MGASHVAGGEIDVSLQAVKRFTPRRSPILRRTRHVPALAHGRCRMGKEEPGLEVRGALIVPSRLRRGRRRGRRAIG
jgi:hypothetical protein